MANKTRGGIYVAVGLVMMGAGAYLLYTNTKRYYAGVIAKAGHGSVEKLMGMDKEYIRAYAKAIKKGADTFTVDGKTFDGKTGRVK
jgi:hypothetical protein